VKEIDNKRLPHPFQVIDKIMSEKADVPQSDVA
jgi:hypothetical protein